MPTAYQAPVDDYMFLLHELIAPEAAHQMMGMAPEDTRAILGQAARFFEQQWAPLDAPGDEEGCRFAQGQVHTPTGFKAGYAAMCAAGWNSVAAPVEFGGAGLPEVIGQAVREFSAASCNSLGLYAGLTAGAQATVRRTGSDWMRERVVPPMVEGRWAGTMCLTEPHCGTDLRLMKTRAVEQADGSWRLSGTKIFISGGDQDLTDNVIHLVLAKIPEADGRVLDDLGQVSLFLVSKHRLDPATGALGENNGVSVAGIEHKMGLKGSATCTMVFENAQAWRLGESTRAAGGPRKSSAGMSGMFDMMNSARLGTGLQALSSATRAYGHAAHYARERLAGRAARPEDRTGGAADPIIVHPDVRRLLLRQAAFLEGARALGLWVRVLLDDQDARRALVGSFLTPVIKAFFSDRAFDSANDAMQLMGGHGYIRDNGVEQLVRDCRIFQLYEGANGVQALDLALRKLPQGGGEALPGLLAMVDAVIAEADRHDELRSHGQALRRACEAVRAVAQWLQSPERQPCDIGAASYDFLHMVGIVAVGFMWLRMALLALDRLPAAGNAAFFQRKLELARYWFERELPLVAAYGQRAQVGAAGLMALPADQF